MFLKLCKKNKIKNLGFSSPLLNFLVSPLSKTFLSHKLCIQHSRRTIQNSSFAFKQVHTFSLTFFFVFVFFELYIAALPRGGRQRRYGWKPCTLWFCPLPNAVAAGWGAAVGCAVGAPYEAVGWLGSAKLWPKAVRSCPYPYWL